MNLTTINESFGAAFSFSISGKKRGLQAQVAIEAEVDPANVSAMSGAVKMRKAESRSNTWCIMQAAR